MPTLDWATREADMRAADAVPYRLLDDVPKMGAGTGTPLGLLVQGDNLEALKSLLPFYGGRVRCIYIDPPYNTRSAFQHYDDNLEHAKWLGMMVPRLQLLREFLSEDGSIWVSIDDNEGHYLKVVMDEVFGRRNFVANVVWQKKYTRANDARFMSDTHDHILCFVKNVEKSQFAGLPREAKQNLAYKNPDNDPRGPWKATPIHAKSGSANNQFEHRFQNGFRWKPPSGTYHRYSQETLASLDSSNQIWFGKSGKSGPARKSYLTEVKQDVIPVTIWPHDEASSNHDAKNEIRSLFPEAYFDTPKPERLLERILHIATDPGDLVLDSFLGSGTTAAVAHKMGRRWIGIEMGDHARTHAAARMRKVVEGERGGISKDVGWKGGGAFRFAALGAVAFEAGGRLNPAITWADLAAHVWFAETRRACPAEAEDAPGPIIGVHEGGAVALLWNGVLRDRSAAGGNVLVHPVLRLIRDDLARRHPGHDGPLTVYGAATRLSPATLKAERITFKQTPYAVARRA